MNSWTPEQREQFLLDWNDVEPFRQVSDEDLLGQIFHGEPMVQAGRGQKRSHDEMNRKDKKRNEFGKCILIFCIKQHDPSFEKNF